jgi:hypothetical protein
MDAIAPFNVRRANALRCSGLLGSSQSEPRINADKR